MEALGVVGLALEGRVAILMRISRSSTWQRLADGRLVGSVDHARVGPRVGRSTITTRSGARTYHNHHFFACDVDRVGRQPTAH